MVSIVSGPLPMRLKLIHGFGAVAFGVKDSGFSFFLLIYYNQVLGMDAGLVSLALGAALLIDAVVDPLIGNLSDRTYTRWGRRLPWLYVAPIPLGVAWVMLWSPAGGAAPSFGGLLAIAVVVRLLLSACEVPSISLVPELTADYDERTTLFRYRFLFGWMGGLLMLVLAYTVFMPGQEGLLQKEGYRAFGVTGAIVMAVAVIGSALGQHRLIAHLPLVKPPPFSLRTAFAEIREAFSERAFLIFAAGGLAAYVNQGMTLALANYINLFIWEFDQTALVFYPLVLFVSVILMFFIVGPMHRAFGKAHSAAIAALGAIVFMAIPYALRLLGFWPEVGSNASTGFYYLFHMFANALAVTVLLSSSSMIAEIVEAFQERSGRRAEGSFYAGNWLVQKCATGLGILVAGQVIAYSQLSTNAEPGTVPGDVIDTLIVLYVGLSVALALVAAYWLARFPISREDHEQRLEKLNDLARADIDGGTTVP